MKRKDTMQRGIAMNEHDGLPEQDNKHMYKKKKIGNNSTGSFRVSSGIAISSRRSLLS